MGLRKLPQTCLGGLYHPSGQLRSEGKRDVGNGVGEDAADRTVLRCDEQAWSVLPMVISLDHGGAGTVTKRGEGLP